MGRLFALLAAIAFAPVHAIIAALIYLQDGGPVFYRARRLGRHGRPFTMYKYRSMRVGAEPIVDPGLKTVVQVNDKRVTRLGKMLRCGVDEAPQLLHVI